MSTTRKRIAALVLTAVVAASGAVAVMSTVAADDAQALKVKWVVGPE